MLTGISSAGWVTIRTDRTDRLRFIRAFSLAPVSLPNICMAKRID